MSRYKYRDLIVAEDDINGVVSERGGYAVAKFYYQAGKDRRPTFAARQRAEEFVEMMYDPSTAGSRDRLLWLVLKDTIRTFATAKPVKHKKEQLQLLIKRAEEWLQSIEWLEDLSEEGG